MEEFTNLIPSEDDVHWALEQFRELWRLGNIIGIPRDTMRYALISFLVMDEKWIMDLGVDSVALRTWDRAVMTEAYTTVFDESPGAEG